MAGESEDGSVDLVGMFSEDEETPSPAPGAGFDPINLRDRVVIKLLFDEVVRIEQIERAWYAWQERKQQGKTEELWRVLAEDPKLDRERVFAEAARIFAFRTTSLSVDEIKKHVEQAREKLGKERWQYLTKLQILPVPPRGGRQEKQPWVFITHDPLRPEVNQLLRTFKLPHYEIHYAPESTVQEVIDEVRSAHNEFLERINEEDVAFDLRVEYEAESRLIDEDALEAEISRSKLINLFEAMLVEAVRAGASDIHLFPNAQEQIEIHFRIDGDLELWHVESRVHPEAFLAVAKDNASNVDRFERDAAQDGFIQRIIDDTLIRFRVSVLPLAGSSQAMRSESIVIRVLDDRKAILDLKQLGLSKLALERFEHAIRQPYGMVILTGPTGSGKTTTLYAALHQVVSPKRNVLTVEDPVEYILPGVRQIKLNHKLGLEQALRAILRHDPDIVMVGEMRDRETAELAIKLANTGHLTFSTLHTNDAPSAVSRLYKMGVEPFLIAYAINLVVAQRLIRKLCPSCKEPDDQLDTALLSRLGFTDEECDNVVFYKEGVDPKCKTCGGKGFVGRRAITETMLFSPAIRQLIVAADDMVDEDGLRAQAIKEGMLTLQDSARELVRAGETSVREMLRVVFTDF